MKQFSISQLQPLAGYVLVEPQQQETKTSSGIVLPESEGEKPQYGKVLAVGDCSKGCCSPKGDMCCGGGCCGDMGMDSEKCEIEVEVGDTVVYKKWGGNDVMIDDVEYQFLKHEDILAVVTKTTKAKKK